MSHKMQKQHFIYCTKLVLVILHDYMSIFCCWFIITTFKCLTWILLAPNANLQKSFTPIFSPQIKTSSSDRSLVFKLLVLLFFCCLSEFNVVLI